MGNLFDSYNVEPKKGKDFTIGDCHNAIFISESDRIFCYQGLYLNDEDGSSARIFKQPYHLRKYHSIDAEILDEVKGFYRVENGCILLDNYIDNGFYGNNLYKKIDCGIHFPCPDNYYAVVVNGRDDENLTRGIFGLIHEEIEALLEAYAITMGTNRVYGTYPRLTRSTTGSNYCELTETWIPRQFPYIAFNESMYEFSHISLYGFYRHVQLVTGKKINSVFSKCLLKSGGTEDILKRVFDIDTQHLCYTKVNKTILENE